ncbi:MAG TPA: NYN domain-containing protein [Thermoanaerobaculia bacterium]|nr:NYN domain-containing protein [Thermoanaerobaculia bacterium]
MPDRAVLFVDGNNWYHAIREAGVEDRGRLDYAVISRKLAGPREWIGTRYYIGRVPQQGETRLYAEQRRFLAQLAASDPRISAHLGRLEPRLIDNPAARELQQYLTSLQVRLDSQVFHELLQIAQRHRRTPAMVEKAVDVMLAVDMVVMAERDAYDSAYLLSADGDFTPAIEAVRSHGTKVYVASTAHGAQLARAASTFIRLGRERFTDCYR